MKSAEGDVGVAGAVPNPALTLGYGRVLGYNPAATASSPTSIGPNGTLLGSNQTLCSGCSADEYTIGLSDQAAIEDSLSGKRDLRLKVARTALASRQAVSRNDALRTIQFQVKSAYANVAQAQRALAFAKENQATNVKSLQLFQIRLKSGAINEGISRASRRRSSRPTRRWTSALGLAAGPGRARVPPRRARTDARVHGRRQDARLSRCPRRSPTRQPRPPATHRLRAPAGSLALGYQRASAEAAIALAKRQRFPDITLSGAVHADRHRPDRHPAADASSSASPRRIPIFYQQQGEIRKAEADYDTQSLQQAKATAQVVSDVSTAMAGFEASRTLVERMEKAAQAERGEGLLDHAAAVRQGRSATLMDYLDAQRTYIATNVEYLQDLANYWTAVFQLEQAVGMELQR